MSGRKRRHIALIVSKYVDGKPAALVGFFYLAFVVIAATYALVMLLFLDPVSPPTEALLLIAFPGSWLGMIILLMPDLWGFIVVGGAWYPWVSLPIFLLAGVGQAWLIWLLFRGRRIESPTPAWWENSRKSRIVILAILIICVGTPVPGWELLGLNLENRGTEKVKEYLRAYENRDFEATIGLMCTQPSAKDPSAAFASRPRLTKYRITSASASADLSVEDSTYEAEVQLTFSNETTKNDYIFAKEFYKNGGLKVCVQPMESGPLLNGLG